MLARQSTMMARFAQPLCQRTSFNQSMMIRGMANVTMTPVTPPSQQPGDQQIPRPPQSFIQAIQKFGSATEIQRYHMSHIALAGGIPLALILSPSILVTPLDLALGLMIPYHAHVGMVNVMDDYVPKPYRPLSKGIMIAVTLITTFGLLKINLCGAGLTESVKSLWREAPAKTTTTTVTKVERN